MQIIYYLVIFMSHLHLNELSLICDMWLNKITYLLNPINYHCLIDVSINFDTKVAETFLRILQHCLFPPGIIHLMQLLHFGK